MTNHTFPHHTDTDSLREIAEHANAVLRSAEIVSRGVRRPATRDELERVDRVGSIALDELVARGVAVRPMLWLRPGPEYSDTVDTGDRYRDGFTPHE